MRFIFSIIIICCFTFCSDSNSSKKVKNATYPKNLNVSFDATINALKQTLIKNGYKIIPQNKLGKALTKQNATKQISFEILKKSDNSKYQFSYFEYSDKLSCEKACQKYVSQIGDLEQITIGKKMKHVKSTPMYAIFNNTTICTLKYACNTNADFILKVLKQQFKQSESKIMKIDCGGPLIWE